MPMSKIKCSYPSSSRPPVATLLLEKFQALDVLNQELQAENVELKGRAGQMLTRPSEDLKLLSKASSEKELPTKAPSMPSSREGATIQKDGNFEFFCQQLSAMGVDAARENAQQDLEELFSRVQAQEVQISKKGGRLLQQYSVVRVYLLAKIAGSERCLIEHDRFDLRSGKQKTLMIPLEVRMREDEGWREAARRGLQTMVGLAPEWQEKYIVLDESSHICDEESSSAHDENPLDFLVSVMVHELHARLSGFSASQVTPGSNTEEHLEKVGLPSGRDFVFCEESRSTVHVWCWKSREYERNGRMKAFEKYLAEHGVDTSKLGVGNNKTLFKFYHEVKEEKHCSLMAVPAGPGAAGPKLLRVVNILKIKLLADVNKHKRVLMENEKYDAGGRKRAGGQLIVRKLCDVEDWRAAVPLAIAERIGVNFAVQAECFSVDHEKMTYTEEEVPSKGFVGIMSNYKIITVPVLVIDPQHEDMERIGLPRGNDFVSKEYKEDEDSPNLHVWSWAPAVDEEVVVNFAGTGLEALNRDLYDIEHVLTQAIADPQLAGLGLDKPFKTSLQKLKQCAEGLSNIDKTVKDVDVGDIMGGGGADTHDAEDENGVSDLRSFIKANFIRADQPAANESEGSRRDRRTSFNVQGSTMDSDNLGWFNLDRLFTNAPAEVQNIVENRNDWGFDFFALSQKCGSSTTMLQSYGTAILVPFLVISFGCEDESAHRFVSTAAALYLDDNPYHGPIHAAQVCHLSRWLTKAMQIMEKQSELESTAFMLAAFCHDIKHIGRNNNFCVQSEHPLALLYNNRSVLERYHSSTCLELLESTKLLKELPLEDRKMVRSHIIEYILATDMAEHFETISKFRVRREAQDFSFAVEADRRFVARLCLKAGDLGHACLPWLIHVNWATRVTQEFYSQGEAEKQLGLPISALCDRKEAENIAKSQNGFLNFVVAPLYQLLSESQPVKSKDDEEQQRRRNLKEDAADGEEFQRSMRRFKSVVPPLAVESAVFNVDKRCFQELQNNAKRWQEDDDTVKRVQADLAGSKVAPDTSQGIEADGTQDTDRQISE